MRKITKYSLLICLGAVNLACNTPTKSISPYYSEHIGIQSLLNKPIALTDQKDLIKLQQAKWSSENELVNTKSEKITVSNCVDLVNGVNNGYKASSYREQESVNALYLDCDTLQETIKLSDYSISYLNGVKLDKYFTTIAPADFAMIISKDDIKKAKAATNWEAMSKIQKIEIKNEEQTIFYDSSDGMQKISLLAKGDYNDDAIEDRFLYIENNLISGSYSTVQAFVITRLEKDGPIKILKKLK